MRVFEDEERIYEMVEGSLVTRVTIPAPPKKARTTRMPATADMIDPTLQGRVARALAAGYRQTGTASFAGYICDMFNHIDAIGRRELCLLNDPAAPVTVQGFPLHDAIILSSRGGKLTYSNVARLIDLSLLDVPSNVPSTGGHR